MKKNKLNIIFILMLFIGIGYLSWSYLSLFSIFSHLPENKTKLEILEYALKQDTAIEDSNIKGKSAIQGGPYKVGDTVISQGMAIKVEKIGWRKQINEEILNFNNVEKQGIAVFKLTIYNYNMLPYDIKGEDIKLISKINETNFYEQDLTATGYDNWKYIKGSFQLGSISSKTYREGYIFFPANEIVKKGGLIKVYLQNIPIEFKY